MDTEDDFYDLGDEAQTAPIVKTLQRPVYRTWSSEMGQDLIEYALIAALISVLLVASLRGVASAVSNTLNAVSNALTTSL